MIEQQQQQQQILNSIMIANCNKYFSHHQLNNNHPQSPSAAAATKSSLVKIMSNPGVSGATNSVAAAMNNNNSNKAAQTANGMSSSSAAASMGIGSGASPVSPQPPAIANKMGSRRIFSPHFKIQVLESYRNDSDCKGNQRATARKYGIHRRQIQKWLQCETALRTSVSSNGGGGGARSPPASLCHSNKQQQVDTNNNTSGQQAKRTLGNGPKTALSTSSNQARHSVDSNDSGAVRLAAVAEDCASVSETNTRIRLCGGGSSSNATHTRQISMEFFSSTTTSLIINGGAAGGPDGGRKIESMNEAAAAAVPIKPEFCFNAAPATTSSSAAASPHPSSSAISRGNVEMPSTAAAMLKHQHHLHHDLYQINGGGGGGVEEDAPHHSLISAVPTLPPFISTIYGPQSLLAFPCTFPFEYPPSVLQQHHNHHLSPIDLSVGNAERRHAVHLYRRSPLIQVDDARVPSRSVSADEVKPSQATPISPYESMTTSSAAPIDLSCSRKRKANVSEPAKPPKLFKPYLLDDHEEEEELKVVDDEEEQSPKEDSFLDQDLTGLKVKLGHRFEYPTAVYPHYPGASPTYESLYFSHENLTLYPSPRHYRFDASPSSDSSPRHHPSRPASLFDNNSTNSSEAAYGNYHPSSPASSLDVRSSPPVFSGSSNWPVHEMRSRVIGAVF